MNTIKTVKKIRATSKSPTKPIKIFKSTGNITSIVQSEKTADMSFEQWLSLGKSMGWHVQIPSYPTIMASQNSDQLKRYVDFIKYVDQIVDGLNCVEGVMTKINDNFKTEDKGKIFDSDIMDKLFSIRSMVDYFRVAALEQKEKVYEQQWYAIYQRYKTDEGFKDKADALLKELAKG